MLSGLKAWTLLRYVPGLRVTRRGLNKTLFAGALALVSPWTQAADLVPVVDCIEYDPAKDLVVAHFGYYNTVGEEIFIEIGPNNKFIPDPIDQGQSNFFLPGYTRRDVTVSFRPEKSADEGLGSLRWSLNGHTATVDLTETQRCKSTLIRLEQSSGTVDAGGTVTLTGGVEPPNDLPGELPAEEYQSQEAAKSVSLSAVDGKTGKAVGSFSSSSLTTDGSGTFSVDYTAPDKGGLVWLQASHDGITERIPLVVEAATVTQPRGSSAIAVASGQAFTVALNGDYEGLAVGDTSGGGSGNTVEVSDEQAGSLTLEGTLTISDPGADGSEIRRVTIGDHTFLFHIQPPPSAAEVTVSF